MFEQYKKMIQQELNVQEKLFQIRNFSYVPVFNFYIFYGFFKF